MAAFWKVTIKLMLFYISLCDVDASITSRVRNIVVRVGSQVQLTCTVEDSCRNVNWFNCPRQDCQLSNSGQFAQGYTGDGDLSDNPTRKPRDCSMIITSATLSHAGQYNCSLFSTTGNTQLPFFVSVIDIGYPRVTVSEPAAVLDGQTVTLTCSVSFKRSSELSEVMTFKSSNTDLTQSRLDVSPEFRAKLTTNVSVTTARSRQKVLCVFSVMGLVEFGTSNEIILETQLPEVKSPFAPSNVTVGSGHTTDYHVGDEVTCLADALPRPSYNWTKQDDGSITLSNMNVFTCDDNTAGATYVCIAFNDEGSIRSMPITCLKSSKAAAISISIVGILIAVVIIVIIVVILCKKKRESKRWDNSAHSDSGTVPLGPVGTKPNSITETTTPSQRYGERSPFMNASTDPDVVQNVSNQPQFNQPSKSNQLQSNKPNQSSQPTSEVLYAELQVPQKPRRGEPRQQEENVYAAVAKA